MTTMRTHVHRIDIVRKFQRSGEEAQYVGECGGCGETVMLDFTIDLEGAQDDLAQVPAGG